MAAAAIARQAAAVVHARALAALARAALVDDGEGDAFGCVRLLLTELAAALHVEPGRQGQQGAGAGQGLPRTRRGPAVGTCRSDLLWQKWSDPKSVGAAAVGRAVRPDRAS